MSSKPKISPSNTYVLDEDLLSEMDDIELTGLVRELTDQILDESSEPPADEPDGDDQQKSQDVDQ